MSWILFQQSLQRAVESLLNLQRQAGQEDWNLFLLITELSYKGYFIVEFRLRQKSYNFKILSTGPVEEFKCMHFKLQIRKRFHLGYNWEVELFTLRLFLKSFTSEPHEELN